MHNILTHTIAVLRCIRVAVNVGLPDLKFPTPPGETTLNLTMVSDCCSVEIVCLVVSLVAFYLAVYGYCFYVTQLRLCA